MTITYTKFNQFLLRIPMICKEFVLSFEQIGIIIGETLPKSAFTRRQWWENEKNITHSHAKAWRDAGWKIDKGGVSLKETWVRFIRLE